MSTRRHSWQVLNDYVGSINYPYYVLNPFSITRRKDCSMIRGCYSRSPGSGITYNGSLWKGLASLYV